LRWCHSFGCGQWFNVLRHTVTHRIIAVYRMWEPRPQVHKEPI
jgi:sarcosine oxidase delta subunit